MRVIIEEVVRNLYLLRVDDDRVNFFEGLWEIPEGITYNSYLLLTEEGAILFDGWKYNYASLHAELVESLVDPKEIKYIVVHHMEPDHTGSLELIARKAVNAVVLAHPLAARIAKQSYPTLASKMRAVKDGDVVRIGGFELEIVYTPWLHWPETMVTWVTNTKTLLTCDVFGSYGALPYVYDDEASSANMLDLLLWYAQKYVVTVIGHYRSHIVKALEKLRERSIDPSIIAPGHGVVWRRHVGEVIRLYERLGRGEASQRKALVATVTMYGSSDLLGGAAARVLARLGYRIEYYTLNDTKRHHMSDIVSHAADAEIIVLAGATYEAESNPLLRNVALLLCEKAAARKRVVLLTPYGWGGVAGKKISEILSKCGFEVSTLELHIPAPPVVTRELLSKLEESVKKLIVG